MTAQRTPTVETVRALVATHLGMPAEGDRPHADEDLWDLGLTSLNCLRLMLRIEDTFGVTLPERALKFSTFRSTTAIAIAVDEARAEGMPSDNGLRTGHHNRY
ncbi:phosphopantetheine-binding protein [Streptomyces netropsis]|uniref:phosphopantetheine-binding protein n=1 Tax=Streptomyces netropsis TaxID=55404 RepID=UPI00379E72E2